MKPPFSAYKGQEPYIFISYDHVDDSSVYPTIEWLRHQGFNIWYDDGITGGSKWLDEIAHAINESHLLIYFLSSNSVNSDYCQKEIHFGISQEKPLVVIEIEPTELSGGLKLSLGDIQIIRQFNLTRSEFESKVMDATRLHIQHRTRVVKDQTIVYSDIRAFEAFSREATLTEFEDLLIHYDNLAQTAAHDHGGVVRRVEGDSCLLSFPETDSALLAVQHFVAEWQIYITERSIQCPMVFGVNRGTMNILRSFIYGTAIDITIGLCDLAKGLPGSEQNTTTLVSNRVVNNASGSWHFKATQQDDFFVDDNAQYHSDRRSFRNLHRLGLARLQLD